MSYKSWEIPLKELLDDILRPLDLRCPREVRIRIEHIVPEEGQFAGQDWWTFDSEYLNAPGGLVTEFRQRVEEFAENLTHNRNYIHIPCNELTETRRFPLVKICRSCGMVFEIPHIYPSLLAKLKTLLEIKDEH